MKLSVEICYKMANLFYIMYKEKSLTGLQIITLDAKKFLIGIPSGIFQQHSETILQKSLKAVRNQVNLLAKKINLGKSGNSTPLIT